METRAAVAKRKANAVRKKLIFVTSENSDDVGEGSGPATAGGVGDGGAYEEQGDEVEYGQQREGSLRERLRLWSRGKGFWIRNLRWETRESEVDVLMDEGQLGQFLDFG
ncbi:hypothetical protein Fmac_026936 [Flemingia macrophylla]|uniref:Uncharacterized protein n=1 Tax=Flemingia macrophylla TaxID=520843 RepID=A0ABD1LG86_9FABA